MGKNGVGNDTDVAPALVVHVKSEAKDIHMMGQRSSPNDVWGSLVLILICPVVCPVRVLHKLSFNARRCRATVENDHREESQRHQKTVQNVMILKRITGGSQNDHIKRRWQSQRQSPKIARIC